MSDDLVVKGVPQVQRDIDGDSLDTNPLEPIDEQEAIEDIASINESVFEPTEAEEETE